MYFKTVSKNPSKFLLNRIIIYFTNITIIIVKKMQPEIFLLISEIIKES